jgi:carboxypeptidase Taq
MMMGMVNGNNGSQKEAMSAASAYAELIRRTKEESLLASCLELLGWDELTVMPRAGAAHRGEQFALLSGLYHARATEPRIGELLAAVEGSVLVSDPDSPAAVNVREIRRAYDRQVKLPRSLVEELARVTTLAQQEWEYARAASDFGRFAPWLARVVALKRSEADALGYESEAYDALLEDYEPGARGAALAELFDSLRRALVPLAEAITHAPRQADPSLLRREYPIDRQRAFAAEVVAGVGFDFRGGRIDETVHPFCAAIGPGDCRLVTRYHCHNLNDGLFGVLHEVGHGLYEQGLDVEHHGTPMGEVPSLALHESQARLWENTVGRGRPFWEHFFPRLRQAFPTALRDVSLDAFSFAVNHVESSSIRVGADEVTYNLHILLRFDLERALMSGDLSPADVPGAWKEAARRYLGIVPANDAEGCLQDGHWASGLIGYFPTYTLGNLIAAQLHAATIAEVGDLDREFARGRFGGLLDWLRDRVHRHGSRYSVERLMRQVSGAPLDYRPFVEGLQRKYAVLYEL